MGSHQRLESRGKSSFPMNHASQKCNSLRGASLLYRADRRKGIAGAPGGVFLKKPLKGWTKEFSERRGVRGKEQLTGTRLMDGHLGIRVRQHKGFRCCWKDGPWHCSTPGSALACTVQCTTCTATHDSPIFPLSLLDGLVIFLIGCHRIL